MIKEDWKTWPRVNAMHSFNEELWLTEARSVLLDKNTLNSKLVLWDTGVVGLGLSPEDYELFLSSLEHQTIAIRTP